MTFDELEPDLARAERAMPGIAPLLTRIIEVARVDPGPALVECRKLLERLLERRLRIAAALAPADTALHTLTFDPAWTLQNYLDQVRKHCPMPSQVRSSAGVVKDLGDTPAHEYVEEAERNFHHSFDHLTRVIEWYGCNVHPYDPDPASVSWPIAKPGATRALAADARSRRQPAPGGWPARHPTIALHATRLRQFASMRLAEAAGVDLPSATVDEWFASRDAVSAPPRHSKVRLPGAAIADADARARAGQPPHLRQLLVIGGAGDGKTTLVHQLLHRFADVDAIGRYRVVPVFANCITIASFLRQPGREEAAQHVTATDDDHAIDEWLTVAIVPQSNEFRRDDSSASSPVDAFVSELRDGGYGLLFLVDGLDELDPSGRHRGVLARRLFRALQRWVARHSLLHTFYIGTSRPHEETAAVAEAFGLQPVTLQKPAKADLLPVIARLLTTGDPAPVEPPPEMLEEFWAEFARQTEIDRTLVYLPMLAAYYRDVPERARSQTVTRRGLMEIETGSIVRKIRADLAALVDADILPADLDASLRQVLLEVALRSLDPGDADVPKRHSRPGLAEFASVKAVPGLPGLVMAENLAHRLLHFLVYDNRGRSDERSGGFHYRLPHNEHRDYLLADGLFRFVQGADVLPAIPDMSNALAASYLNAERVQAFMRHIVDAELGTTGSDSRRAFASRLVRIMNDRAALPGEHPTARTKASPHGALLTLLLSLGDLPDDLRVHGKGISFQGAAAGRPGAMSLDLPLLRDCTGAVFREATLQCVNLSGLTLDDADFDNADLRGAALSGSTLINANLRNVAMGEFNGTPTVLTAARMAGADLFNYRFQGLKGYYHFWDLEVAGDQADAERYVLAAGSRGQLLAFDLDDESQLRAVTVRTSAEASDEVLDISRHPFHRNLVVVTGRDRSVRILRLPEGGPRDWARTQLPDGSDRVDIRQVGFRDLTPYVKKAYPRRAQFSASGSWLAVTTRDQGVAFFRVSPDGDNFTLEGPTFGLEHTGPVMCIAADSEPTRGTASRPPDRFFTAGYDGRLALWREEPGGGSDCWKRARHCTEPRTVNSGRRGPEVDIFRAVAPSANGLWAGTEMEGALLFYTFADDRASEPRDRHTLRSGVFALAADHGLVAAGLADGGVVVYRVSGNGCDWERPILTAETNGEIVRSLQFIRGGRQLLAATWDACLFRFDLERMSHVAFEFPSSLWQPQEDVMQIQFDGNPLAAAEGISNRMMQYLLAVQAARQRR